MSPVNRKPGMPMLSMFQSVGPTPLPGMAQPMGIGGLMQPPPGQDPLENLSDKSLLEDDPNAKSADPDMMAKEEAGFLPANMHCETCAHLDNAMCSKYGFPVADEDGCSNGYEPIDSVMSELEGGEEDETGMEELSTNAEEIPEEEENPVDEEPEESEESTGKGGKKSMKGKK